MKISKHFSIHDVEFDLLAIKLGINNACDYETVENAKLVAEELDTLKDKVDFNIRSWYRSPELEREYSKQQFAVYCIENRKPINEDSWVDYLESSVHWRGTRVCVTSPEPERLIKLASKTALTAEQKPRWICLTL